MAESVHPDLSVVIPTHNRCAQLLETLGALAVQTLLPARFEVIVVIDAGTDDTAARLDHASWPFACRHVASNGRGAAAARNTGAALAAGERLFFLDDDIKLCPGALALHLAAPGERVAIIGQSVPVLDESTLFGRSVADWWRGRFRAMRDPGYRFGYRDVMSGNLSVGWADFVAVGGFDAALRCREDYELGYRLLQSGVRIAYAQEARGLHFDASTPTRNLVRARNEGIADLQIARKHGDLFPWLRAANMTATSCGAWLLRFLCFSVPPAGALAAQAAALLPFLERMALRRWWTWLNNQTRALAYQRGVAAEAEGYQELDRLRAAAGMSTRPVPTLLFDILDGPERVLCAVASQRYDAMMLCLGDRIVGERHFEPGLEPLRPELVKAALSETVWHWASAVEAASDLPFLPQSDPDWLADAAVGPGVTIAELDCETWALTVRSELPAFPMRALLRHGRRPLGWVNFPEKPAKNCFWTYVRGQILNDSGLRMRLIREKRFPATGTSLPPISVVVCTRNRADLLRRCIAALKALDYPDYEILIVDNAPSTEATRDLVAADPALRYVREDRPGLDWARNRGISAAKHDIIAYTDDDTTPDRHWLAGLAEAFAEPAVGFVTGLVTPMTLDTDARLYFEDTYGGMGKGFDAITRDPANMPSHDLLWASALGVGANMAFRKSVFEHCGPFDPALDVGTVTRGGGDIEMFHRALAGGIVHVYQPAALVWHEHRADFTGLRRQLADNGSGFASYLMACLRNRTVPRGAVLRFALRAWLWDWQLRRLLRPGQHCRSLVCDEIRGLVGAPRRWRQAQFRATELAAPADPRGQE